MKVVIAGSRSINSYDLVERTIQDSGYEVTEVVSGRARGVDSLGEHWAERHDIPVKKFPADWDKHGKAAGHIRNAEMAKYADAAILIWDGQSRGTKNMIDNMKKLNKHYFL